MRRYVVHPRYRRIRLLQFSGVSSKFRTHLRYLVKAKRISFSKSEGSRALKFQPQKHGVARFAKGAEGFTSQGGYAEEVYFQ